MCIRDRTEPDVAGLAGAENQAKPVRGRPGVPEGQSPAKPIRHQRRHSLVLRHR